MTHTLYEEYATFLSMAVCQRDYSYVSLYHTHGYCTVGSFDSTVASLFSLNGFEPRSLESRAVERSVAISLAVLLKFLVDLVEISTLFCVIADKRNALLVRVTCECSRHVL